MAGVSLKTIVISGPSISIKLGFGIKLVPTAISPRGGALALFFEDYFSIDNLKWFLNKFIFVAGILSALGIDNKMSF